MSGAGTPLTPAPQAPRSLAGGAVLAVVARGALIVSAAAVSVIVARLLGPEGSGEFAVVVGLVTTLFALASIGLEAGVAWMVASRRWSPRSALATCTLAAVSLGAAGAAVGLGIWALTESSAFAGIGAGVVALGVASLPLALAWSYAFQVALARQRYEAMLAIAAAMAIAYVAAVPPLASAHGVRGAVAGLLIGHLAGALAALAWALRAGDEPGEGRGIDLGRLREAVSFGIQLHVANALTILTYRFDLFLLNAYAGGAEAGYYAIAIAVTNVLVILPGALGSVLFPRLASISAESEPDRRRLEDRAIRHAVLIVTVGGLGLAAAIPLLVEPIFGSEFGPAIAPGLILIPGTAALGIASALYAALAGRGRPDYAMRISLLVAPLAVALYFVFVPALDAEGAAIASDLAYLTSAALAAISLRRLSGSDPRRRVRPGREELHDYRRLAAGARARLARG